jgi:HTH-type transcriptional regulator/antitoxin HigA
MHYWSCSFNLVHHYERQRYPIPPSPPHELVGYLMEQRGLKPADLIPVLSSKSRVSEILAGKRGVSKEQAKNLSAYFEVGVQIFL